MYVCSVYIPTPALEHSGITLSIASTHSAAHIYTSLRNPAFTRTDLSNSGAGGRKTAVHEQQSEVGTIKTLDTFHDRDNNHHEQLHNNLSSSQTQELVQPAKQHPNTTPVPQPDRPVLPCLPPRTPHPLTTPRTPIQPPFQRPHPQPHPPRDDDRASTPTPTQLRPAPPSAPNPTPSARAPSTTHHPPRSPPHTRHPPCRPKSKANAAR